MITIVVATDRNGALGVKNRIPWRIKSDLVRLARLTRDQTVIVGRKSYDSMVWYYDRSGKAMPGKTYLVVTRNNNYNPAHDNAMVVHSMQEALTKAGELGNDTFVIGGGSIFNAALPLADRVVLTVVQTAVDGEVDAYFAKPGAPEWQEVSREHLDASDTDEFATEVITLERAK